jgi:hypothetical protein
VRAGALAIPLVDDDMGGLVAEDLRKHGVGGTSDGERETDQAARRDDPREGAA